MFGSKKKEEIKKNGGKEIRIFGRELTDDDDSAILDFNSNDFQSKFIASSTDDGGQYSADLSLILPDSKNITIINYTFDNFFID